MTRAGVGILLLLALAGCGGGDSGRESSGCSGGGVVATSAPPLSSAAGKSSLAGDLGVFQREPLHADKMAPETVAILRDFERGANSLSTPAGPGDLELDRGRAAVRAGDDTRVFALPTSNGWACAIEGGRSRARAPVCWPRLDRGLGWAAASGRCDPGGLVVFGLTRDNVKDVRVEVRSGDDFPAAVGENGFYWSDDEDSLNTDDVRAFRVTLDDGSVIEIPSQPS